MSCFGAIFIGISQGAQAARLLFASEAKQTKCGGERLPDNAQLARGRTRAACAPRGYT